MIALMGVCGFKNSGKTTLCGEIIERLTERGLRVGYIKRTHEAVLSPPNTDSSRVSQAVLWGSDGLRFEEPSPDGDPRMWCGKFFYDRHIVIMEGGKGIACPKIWVDDGHSAIPEDVRGVLGTYSRHRDAEYGPHNMEELLDRAASLVPEESLCNARVWIDGSPLPMKGFVADFVRGGALGMLEALKKNEQGKWVQIALKKGL